MAKKITFRNKKEAEQILTAEYVGKVISVAYVDTYRSKEVTKINKLDRLSIDHKNNINLFFSDNDMISLEKDEFFTQVKLLN